MPNGLKRFFRLFAKNLRAANGPGRYEVNGIPVVCVHCNYTRFKRGQAQLNTALLSFFNLDFANRSANLLICDRCGYVHWFDKDINPLNG